MAAHTLRSAGFALAGLVLTALPAFADHDHDRRAGDGSSGRTVESTRRIESRSVTSRGEVVGRAVPRRAPHYYSPRFIRPTIVNVVPYRPYNYRYRPAFSASFYVGTGYYPYSYVAPPPGYLSAVPGRPYGGVRITDAPRDAQVFVDGYYMGIVDEFDGVFQHMNLEAGPHHCEVVEPGWEPIAFDVNVQPGQTITFRAAMQPGRS